MTHHKTLPLRLIVLAVCLAAFANGCALFGNNANLTPLARSVQARELYISTMHVLAAARAEGKITDDQARTIEAIRAQVATALDTWETAAAGGNAATAAQYAKLANDLLDKLLAWRAMVEAKK